MKLYHNPELPPEHRGAVVMIGNFDGVHAGHHTLIEVARAYANEQNCPFGVLTFEPHPRQFFQTNPDEPPFLLTPGRLRKDLFFQERLDFLILHPFDRAFTELPALHFIERILIQKMSVRAVVVGEDFGFGRKRAGNIGDLQARPEFTSLIVPEKTAQETGVGFASTKIRSLLQNGGVQNANALMGHAFTTIGTVFRNDQTGKAIGFPTLNVRPLQQQIHPLYGVYAGRVMLSDGRLFDAAINWGIRPSVANRGVMYEAHLFNFDEEIYAQTVRIALLEYVRPEKRFSDTNTLRQQIAEDCDRIRQHLATIPDNDALGRPITPDATKQTALSHSQRTAVEAATFRRLVQHLRDHPQVQNIDLMLLANFCRNCLSHWYSEAAEEFGEPLSKAEARKIIYGEPYEDWKSRYQTDTGPEKIAALAANEQNKK